MNALIKCLSHLLITFGERQSTDKKNKAPISLKIQEKKNMNIICLIFNDLCDFIFKNSF